MPTFPKPSRINLWAISVLHVVNCYGSIHRRKLYWIVNQLFPDFNHCDLSRTINYLLQQGYLDFHLGEYFIADPGAVMLCLLADYDRRLQEVIHYSKGVSK